MLLWAGTSPRSWPDIPTLLALGVDPSVLRWTPLMHRISSGAAAVDEVTALPASEIEHRDSLERTPFLIAVSAGRRDLAEALLAKGADMRVTAWCGTTAMHLAAENDLPDLIEWLAGLGFPVDVSNDFQWKPLRQAVSSSLRAAKKLLALGADVNAKKEDGDQVIIEARSREMLELLLDAGADVNAEWAGHWPLKNACKSGDPTLVKFLLDRGAEPDLTSGETALFAAVGSDSSDCVRLLLAAGAKINVRDVDGETCLWRVRSATMARLLLERGADPGIRAPCGGGMAEDWSLSAEVAALFKKARFESKPGVKRKVTTV